MTSGIDESYFKKYVGQAGQVKVRLPQHERDRHTSGSLFHVVWRRTDEARHVKWIRLRKRSGRPEWFEDAGEEEDEALWMNIVEMFYALVLQTLTEYYLELWAPEVEIKQPHAGLNVALPLHQGLLTPEMRKGFGFANLHASSDQEIVNYAKFICSKGGLNAWEADETNGAYQQRGATLFAMGNLHDIKRRALPEEPEVVVACAHCGHTRVDYNAYYTLAYDEYIDARVSTCYGMCEPTAAKIAARQRRAITVHRTTSTSLKKISLYKYHLRYFGRERAVGGRPYAPVNIS